MLSFSQVCVVFIFHHLELDEMISMLIAHKPQEAKDMWNSNKVIYMDICGSS